TLRDAVIDPLARLYLGRALNARYVVLGTLQATPAGLSVAAHLLDTETGARLATAEGIARDRSELKYRLGELARWLLLDPAARGRVRAVAGPSPRGARRPQLHRRRAVLRRRVGHGTARRRGP